MNKYLKNLFILAFSVILALLVTEGLARLFFEPIDFLKPKTISDEILRHKIKPNSGAHDSWGYRNKKVPESAEIVAIGDSHTYGISATASNSWPSILQRITGQEVYNLSLGGYGPARYLYLMQEKALLLKPKFIIVGLYLGNDLDNSFKSVYGLSHWEDYRKPGIESPYEKNTNEVSSSSNRVGGWLNGNSVLYRIISSSFIGDMFRQKRRVSKGQYIVRLELEEYGINTAFTPSIRLQALDLGDSNVREGLSLTLGFLNEMNQLAVTNKIDFLVVVIPTKENVFSKFALESDELANSNIYNRLIENEEVVNKLVKTYLIDHGIAFVDVLEPLRNAAGNEQIYPNNFGGHTNKNGYRIIAETINNYIESQNIQ